MDRSLRRSRENKERSPTRRGNVRDRRGPPQLELQQRYSPKQYTPLTALMSQVLREVQHERFLRWPSQMKSDPARRDDIKYCEFHKDHGHQTDDCIQLKKEIEYLIRRGISADTWPYKGGSESSHNHLVSQPQFSISRL